MENLFIQISQVLGTTLLHSLWQALIMYALLRMFLLCFPATSSANKYNAGLITLAGSVLWPLLTFFIELSKHPFTQQVTNNSGNDLLLMPLPHHAAFTINPTTSYAFDAYLPLLVSVWLTGIVLNSAKLFFGWKNVYQLKQTVIDLPVLENSIQKLSHILKITKKVKVFVSDHLDVPCIVGYLKPMIILPSAVITQFSTEQIQSILIHEMAHIRRNDYFVNVLQQVVGILFFFNPFTLLINRIIYSEREHCCDDMVLELNGQPMLYARTLLQLEEIRRHDNQLALAATGKKYHLLNRIKRMMETKKPINNFRHILVTILLITGSLSTIAWLNPEIKDGKVIISPANLSAFIDTVKKSAKAKPATVAHKSTKAKSAATSKTTTINVGGEYDDPKLAKLTAEIDRRAQLVDKFYDSPEYKKLEQEIDKRSMLIDSFYNSPQIKHLQDSIDQQSKVFDQMNESPEMKGLEKRMEVLGKTIDKYYNSAEYKRLEKIMELQGKLLSEQSGNNGPDYKKIRDAYQKTSEQMKAYNDNPEMKKAQQELREAGEKMNEFYNSDQYKAQRDAINKASAELRKLYQQPMVKQQTEQIKVLSEQLRAYTNSATIKQYQEQLKMAEDALNNYRRSPEFKMHELQIQKQLYILMHQAQSDTTSSGK